MLNSQLKETDMNAYPAGVTLVVAVYHNGQVYRNTYSMQSEYDRLTSQQLVNELKAANVIYRYYVES